MEIWTELGFQTKAHKQHGLAASCHQPHNTKFEQAITTAPKQHGLQHLSPCYRSKYHQVNSNKNQAQPWNTILIQHLKTTKQKQTWEFSDAG